MEEVLISITGHSTKEFDFGVKHIVEEDRKKYEFFEKKKNGDMTKAYEGWKVQQLGVGDSAVAGIKEEDASFKGKEGNMIPWTRRTILYWVKPSKADEVVRDYIDNPTNAVESGFEPNRIPSDETEPVTRDIANEVKEDMSYKEKVDTLWEERNGNL